MFSHDEIYRRFGLDRRDEGYECDELDNNWVDCD